MSAIFVWHFTKSCVTKSCVHAHGRQPQKETQVIAQLQNPGFTRAGGTWREPTKGLDRQPTKLQLDPLSNAQALWVWPVWDCYTSDINNTLSLQKSTTAAKKHDSKQSDGSCTISAKLPAVTWGWMTCTAVTNSEIQKKESHTDLLVLQILPGAHLDQHQAQVITVQLLNDLSLYRITC